jgi:hypothetical protein
MFFCDFFGWFKDSFSMMDNFHNNYFVSSDFRAFVVIHITSLPEWASNRLFLTYS